MFEIEKMEQEFDYSLVDSETADFLRSCEYEMNGIAEDARVKFGGVLKKAQDKLSNHHKGVFYKWFESGGLDKNDVYYSINLYELSTNLDNTKKDNFLNAPKSLQKEVMKKNAPEELKEQVFSGDITTNKQYKELLEAKRQAESQAEQAKKSEQIAIKQLEQEQSKEPKVIEREVVKEVVPSDYEQAKQERDRVLQELKLLKKAQETDYEAESRKIKALELEANKTVLTTKIKIDEFLKDVAVTAFRRGAIASSSEGTKRNLQQGVDELKNFIKEMEMALNGRIEA